MWFYVFYFLSITAMDYVVMENPKNRKLKYTGVCENIQT